MSNPQSVIFTELCAMLSILFVVVVLPAKELP